MTYVTRKQSMNMKKMIVSSILSTSQGATLSNSNIALNVQLGETTIRRIRKSMKDIGLLGITQTTEVMDIPKVPVATFDDFQSRLFDLNNSICVYMPEEYPEAPFEYFENEWKQINTLLKTDGFLSDKRCLEMLAERLEKLENNVDSYYQDTPEMFIH